MDYSDKMDARISAPLQRFVELRKHCASKFFCFQK